MEKFENIKVQIKSKQYYYENDLIEGKIILDQSLNHIFTINDLEISLLQKEYFQYINDDGEKIINNENTFIIQKFSEFLNAKNINNLDKLINFSLGNNIFYFGINLPKSDFITIEYKDKNFEFYSRIYLHIELKNQTKINKIIEKEIPLFICSKKKNDILTDSSNKGETQHFIKIKFNQIEKEEDGRISLNISIKNNDEKELKLLYLNLFRKITFEYKKNEKDLTNETKVIEQNIYKNSIELNLKKDEEKSLDYLIDYIPDDMILDNKIYLFSDLSDDIKEILPNGKGRNFSIIYYLVIESNDKLNKEKFIEEIILPIEFYHIPKIKEKKEKILKEINSLIENNKKSKEYVKEIDKSNKEKLFDFTGKKFTDHELELVDLHNPEKEEERKIEIKKISSQLKNQKLSNDEFFEKITTYGTEIENSIIYETYHHPENFYSNKEIKKAKEGTTLFIEGILGQLLNNNGITYSIEKNNNNNNQDLSFTNLQLISSGDAFSKVLSLSYDFGEEKNTKILCDDEEKQKFIKQKKKEFSIFLNLPEENILISNLRFGTLSMEVRANGRQLTDNELEKFLQDKYANDAKIRCLLKGCKISQEFFDRRGDRNKGWGINEKRGPPGYLEDYDPPIGWTGYSLNVKGKYDNGDNRWLSYTNKIGEWYIAYHGTSGNVANSILKTDFKIGGGQAHKNDKNTNPLNNKKFPICKKGVYCSPLICVGDEYSLGKEVKFEGKEYSFVFMCRVNPYKVRFCSRRDEYWLVNCEDSDKKKNGDEIRPYRILIKEKDFKPEYTNFKRKKNNINHNNNGAKCCLF